MICEFVEIFSGILFKFFLYLCFYRILWEVLVRLLLIRKQPSQSCTERQRPQPKKPQLQLKQGDKEDSFLDKRWELGAIEVGAPVQIAEPLPVKREIKIQGVYYSGLQPRPLRPPVRKYQNYDVLLQDCLKRKILFLDPEYPATTESLFYSEKFRKRKEQEIRMVNGNDATLDWVRPFDMCVNPQFYGGNGQSRLNVIQGGLGVCWLVAAITVISMYPELMHRVAPPQNFIRKRYAGMFHFHFWFFGSWIDVVVDDQLPCISRPIPTKPRRGSRLTVSKQAVSNRPFSIRSRNRNEFAFTLLEKAYAKIHGSYETLEGGFVADAFVDLTGGFAEFHEIRAGRSHFSSLLDSFRMQSLMACFIEPDHSVFEKELPNGLVAGHAYSITNVCQILREMKTNDGQVTRSVESLLRIRNPWGKVEWNGAWSDNSEHWQYVSKRTKTEIGLARQEDGEFWMSYYDFSMNFDAFEIVHLTPYLNVMPNERIPWDTATFHGEWISGVTAGGEINLDINPQYRITLTEPDRLLADGKCTVCIALTQKYRKIMKKMGIRLIQIGFSVYHLPAEYENVAPAPKQFFYPSDTGSNLLNVFLSNDRKPIAVCEQEIRREITLRVRVPPGPYLIVPYSHNAEEGQFLLRVFSSGHAKMNENDRSLEVPTSLPQELSPNAENVNVVVRRYIDILHRYEVEEITWKRLKIIMNHFGNTIPNFKGFNKETVRSAIAMVDQDENGKIDYREFYLLFEFLEHVRRIFIQEDKNKSGSFPASRFNPVITEFGFDLTQSAQRLLYHRYSREDGTFHFDDFLLCMIKTKVLSEIFKYNQTRNGLVKFNFDDWFIVTIFT